MVAGGCRRLRAVAAFNRLSGTNAFLMALFAHVVVGTTSKSFFVLPTFNSTLNYLLKLVVLAGFVCEFKFSWYNTDRASRSVINYLGVY